MNANTILDTDSRPLPSIEVTLELLENVSPFSINLVLFMLKEQNLKN